MSITFSPASVSSAGIQNPEIATSFRRAQWRMLLAAMFCYLFFYTGRQTFGFAIPGIQAEFGVTKEALGWASAALLWCYAIGQAINGNLGDKFGGRRVMSAGAILSFIMNWATSLSTGIVSLAVFWGINGYFQSMGWAPGSRLLSNWGVTSAGRSTGSTRSRQGWRRCCRSPRRWWSSATSSSTGAGFSASRLRCSSSAALRSI
jgi:OPA family glycerol-3-phosphate transporter-like MFS transporter